jgi:GGDEF domain-containing protein
MKRPTFTVSQKIAAGYLLSVLFGLIALGYALSSLHQQTQRSRHLVEVDFRALGLLRDLRATTLAQERLEKQLLVLRDPALLELSVNRRREFSTIWTALSPLPLPLGDPDFPALVTAYQQADDACGELLAKKDWRQAAQCSSQRSSPRREALLAGLDTRANRQQQVIDQTLQTLPASSNRAYRITLLLIGIGLALSAPVALTVIITIHRSINTLVEATKQLAAGSFDQAIHVQGQDEFTLLAREFNEMGQRLKDLEQRSLDANPLTRLPGNLAIDREIEARIKTGHPFSHLYIDLDNFKVFSDRYGYKAGSEVIAQVGDLIRKTVRHGGTDLDLVGHIGGDDYVVLTSPELDEAIAGKLLEEFDRMAPSFYSEEDRRAGSFLARDRFGVERSFPLLTMSIAVIRSDQLGTPTAFAISAECVRMKKHLKDLPGSNLLINRRKIL